ncbi:hypothetical protein [Microcystis phage MaeS]|nr:hypothetical protein [Microcystis phage MaeS]
MSEEKTKKFEVVVTMIVGMAEDVHYHKFEVEARTAKQVFISIRDREWYPYERISTMQKDGKRLRKVYYEWIHVDNIADITISEIEWEEITE